MTDIEMPIRAAPFDHQRNACMAALESFDSGLSRGYALLMQMGTGKSMTSIAITGALYLAGKIQRVLIVAPLSIVGVWQEEFGKFADFEYNLAIISGTGAKKAETLQRLTGAPLQIAVINYESAWRMEKEIMTWRPDLIIADEAHKLKTHNTNVSNPAQLLGGGWY